MWGYNSNCNYGGGGGGNGLSADAAGLRTALFLSASVRLGRVIVGKRDLVGNLMLSSFARRAFLSP